MTANNPSNILETASPSITQALEATMWSVLVRCLLKTLSMKRSLTILSWFPKSRRAAMNVSVPTEGHFRRAGACLGRQLARSQYIRSHGGESTILIGVIPTKGSSLDAHAWLDRLDELGPHQVLHQIHR